MNVFKLCIDGILVEYSKKYFIYNLIYNLKNNFEHELISQVMCIHSFSHSCILAFLFPTCVHRVTISTMAASGPALRD